MSLAASVSEENTVSNISVEDVVICSSEALEAPRNYQNTLRKFIYLFIYHLLEIISAQMIWKGQRSKRLWPHFAYTCNMVKFLDWRRNTTKNISRNGPVRATFGTATSRIHIRSTSGFGFSQIHHITLHSTLT